MANLRIRTSKGHRRVRSWDTPSKYFSITPAWQGRVDKSKRRRYSLTHRRTGLAVASSNRKQLLRYLAAILGALPVKWGDIYKVEALVEPWSKLPLAIQRWREIFTDSL